MYEYDPQLPYLFRKFIIKITVFKIDDFVYK